MRSNFSKVVTFVPKFNGNEALPKAEQLSAELSVMTNGDVFMVAEALSSFGFTDKVEEKNLNREQINSLIETCGQYVPKYAKLIGAEDFTIQDTVTFMHYFDLALELLFQLVSISQPTKADIKN